MTRLLVLGAGGQVGWELRRTLMPLGEVIAIDHDRLDLTERQTIAPALAAIRPDVIVNAAAYTAVDQAESERDLAFRINAEAPAELARWASEHRALLVHYSTDYVFDGRKPSPYNEADPPDPLGVYGASKLAGEHAIRDSGARHLILRTSWVYAARGRNFLLTMLRLAREREELRVVADQVGAPTWARFLAEATALILALAREELRVDRFRSGLYHLTAGGQTSWHGFASAIVETARQLDPAASLRAREVTPIETDQYPLPARRPANSRLSCENVCQRFGIETPDWRVGMTRCLEELMGR